MEIAIAVAHFVGVVVVGVILELAVLLFMGWELQKNQERQKQEISINLGIPILELDSEEAQPKVLKFIGDLYSRERFQNRLSDLAGVLRTIWSWLGWLTELALILWVAWETITGDVETAKYVWFVVGIWLIFWLTGILFAVACRILTGRYPGQAAAARKDLAEFISNAH